MRALVACILLFLALTTIYGEDDPYEQWDFLGLPCPKKEDCTYEGHLIEHGEYRNFTKPCKEVGCEYGSLVFMKYCEEDNEDAEEGVFYPDCCVKRWS